MIDPILTRRLGLEAAAAAGLAAVVAPPAARAAEAPAPAAASVKGTVFESRDGSFRRKSGDPGVPDVMVSNGRDVALTDAQGRWTLPAAGEAVFVVKPSGWHAAFDPASGLTRDFVLLSPAGSPHARFAGLAPTGPLPASLDFGLVRSPEPTRFDALLISDPQPDSAREMDWVREMLADRLAGQKFAFGLDCGDIVSDDLALYPRAAALWGSFGIPWYHARGNHDTNYDAPESGLAAETYKRFFGPRQKAFQYGGATFILLDNIDYAGAAARAAGKQPYRGFFGADQLAFLHNVLAHVPAESLVVVGFHIPLVTAQGSGDNNRAADGRDLLAALATHPHAISFAGHTHTNEHWYLGATDGWTGAGEHHHHVLMTGSGSWWSGPYDERGIALALSTDGVSNGLHVLSVDGAEATTRFVPARGSQAMRIVLESPSLTDGPGQLLALPAPRAALEGARVIVNLFDGGPHSKVEFALGDGPWQPMERVLRYDPFVADVYRRNAKVIKPSARLGPCTHLFQADLAPAGTAALPPGAWTVRVRSSDEFGRTAEGRLVAETAA